MEPETGCRSIVVAVGCYRSVKSAALIRFYQTSLILHSFFVMIFLNLVIFYPWVSAPRVCSRWGRAWCWVSANCLLPNPPKDTQGREGQLQKPASFSFQISYGIPLFPRLGDSSCVMMFVWASLCSLDLKISQKVSFMIPNDILKVWWCKGMFQCYNKSHCSELKRTIYISIFFSFFFSLQLWYPIPNFGAP